MSERISKILPLDARLYTRVVSIHEPLKDAGIIPGYKTRRMYEDAQGNMFYEIEQHSGPHQQFASMLLKSLGVADVVYSPQLKKYLSFGHPLSNGKKNAAAFEQAVDNATAVSALIESLFFDGDHGFTTEGKKKKRIIQNIQISPKGEFYLHDFWDMGEFLGGKDRAVDFEYEVQHCLGLFKEKIGFVSHYATKQDLLPVSKKAKSNREEIFIHFKEIYARLKYEYTSPAGQDFFAKQHERAYMRGTPSVSARDAYTRLLMRFAVLDEALKRFESEPPNTRWN